jgi:hypothetical protein
MADEKTPKTASSGRTQQRVQLNTTNMKSAYCNFFTARANAEEIVLNFGFDDLRGTVTKEPHQVQILHQVVLSTTTARRVKDTLVDLFRKRDAGGVQVTAHPVPAEKPS